MIIGVACLLLAVATLVIGVVVTSLAKRQTNWIKTTGRVVSSEAALDGEEYAPFIRYEYRWEPGSYVGTKVRSGLVRYNWRGPADRLCSRYPAGAQVSVFVNPEDPSDSVLEPGGDSALVPLLICVGGIFALVGFGFLTSA